ncbi:hypothetical protein FALBO_5643 [Fusarium albosuccineum]|uniref:Uncharacterized protein n=1 Tax=Fusarium albosuccineum TaxID=1237068 RepID=A0A8H4PFD1_9HYPO|nr:hypothetical protein FALBO_5643 [Fusarium albosuccineum]
MHGIPARPPTPLRLIKSEAEGRCLVTEMGCLGTKGLHGKHRARQHYSIAAHLAWDASKAQDAAASVPLPPFRPPTSSNEEENVVMTPPDEELPLSSEDMELPDSEDSEARFLLAGSSQATTLTDGLLSGI